MKSSAGRNRYFEGGVVTKIAVHRRDRWTLITLIIGLWLPNLTSAFADPAEVILIRHAEKPETGNDLTLRGRNERPHWLRTSWKLLNCWNSKPRSPSMPSDRKTPHRPSARSKPFGLWQTPCM